jgi:hypothetical protein
MSRDVAIARLREGVKAGTISIDACNFDARRIAICCQAFASEIELRVSGRGWRGSHYSLAWMWFKALYASTTVATFVWTFDTPEEAALFFKHATFPSSRLSFEAMNPDYTTVTVHLRPRPLPSRAPTPPPEPEIRPDIELVFQPTIVEEMMHIETARLIETQPTQPLVPVDDQPYELPAEQEATNRILLLPRPPPMTAAAAKRAGGAAASAAAEVAAGGGGTPGEGHLEKNLEYVYARHAASTTPESIKFWAMAPVLEWIYRIADQPEITFNEEIGYLLLKEAFRRALGIEIDDDDFDFDYAFGVLCERLFKAMSHASDRFNEQFFGSWVHVGLFGRAGPPPESAVGRALAKHGRAQLLGSMKKVFPRGFIIPGSQHDLSIDEPGKRAAEDTEIDVSAAEIFTLYNTARLNVARAIVDDIYAEARQRIVAAVTAAAPQGITELRLRRFSVVTQGETEPMPQFDALYAYLHNYYHEKIELVVLHELAHLGVTPDMYVRLDADIYAELTGQAARESDREYMAAALAPLERDWLGALGVLRRVRNAEEDEPDEADALLSGVLSRAREFFTGSTAPVVNENGVGIYTPESERGAHDLLFYRFLRVGSAEYNPRAFDGVRVQDTLRIPFSLNTVPEFLANPSAYAGQFVANIREQLYHALVGVVAKKEEYVRMVLGPVGIMRGMPGTPQRRLTLMYKNAQPRSPLIVTTGVLVNMSSVPVKLRPALGGRTGPSETRVVVPPWGFYVYKPVDEEIVHFHDVGDEPVAFMHLAFDVARAITDNDDPETDMLTAAPRFYAAKDKWVSLYVTPVRSGTFAMWMFAHSISVSYIRDHNIPAIAHFRRKFKSTKEADEDEESKEEGPEGDDTTSTESGAMKVPPEYDLLGSLITRKMENRMRNYVDPRVAPHYAGEALARERKDLTTLLYYVWGQGMRSDNTRIEDNAYALSGEELAQLTQLIDDRIVLRAAQPRFVYPVGGRFRAMSEDLKHKFHWNQVLL